MVCFELQEFLEHQVGRRNGLVDLGYVDAVDFLIAKLLKYTSLVPLDVLMRH